MKKDQARLVVYQLAESLRLLASIASGTIDAKEGATAYLYRLAAGITKQEVDAFFASEKGQMIARNL